MSKTIQIRGTIVDGWFDHPFFDADIKAGILTPSSRFVRELREALDADTDPVTIEINSVGGDVFAGAEMLAAIQDAGDRVERVTVGGLAASMAANIALMAARPLAVHTNSLLYFHSAVSDVWGGPGAHADESEMLDKINAPMIAKLKAVGVPAARVDRGFEDGRNLVLSADEAAQWLGASIIGKAAAAPAKASPETIARIEKPAANLERLADYTATLTHVAKLAAWVPTADVAETADNAPAQDTPKTAPETAQDAPADGDGANTSPEGETPAETRETGADGDSADNAANAANAANKGESETEENAEKPISEGNPAVIAALTKQLRSVQSNAAKKINELKASLEQSRAETAAALKERDEVRAQRDEAQGRLADTQAQLAERTAQLEAERDAHAALVGAVLSPESDMEESESDTPHIDRMASFHSVDERLAYATAHRDEIAAERNRKH